MGLRTKPPCDVCEHYADRHEKPTLCEDCVPELWPEHRDAVRVFVAVQDQVIVAPDGSIVGLDQNAIHGAMSVYGCIRPEVFEKVVMLGREFIAKKAEEK